MRTKVPDVLVLGGGGIVGGAWMSGFLAGAHQDSGVDFREAAMFVGTSAGSIVAAHLAAGIPPGAPRVSARAARPPQPAAPSGPRSNALGKGRLAGSTPSPDWQ